MPDFQPTWEVINISFFLSSSMSFLTNHDFCHFLQNTVPAPRARTISYNAAGPISALGFKSTTLAQLMLDMPHQTQILSVQLLMREKLHLWLLIQLPKRKELPKEFLTR
jgi:hypothetical protein